ncbi:PREDICTED: DNA topoisomerase I, mitochondrial-like [Amphimedon queenslandica]|uniref:DNA topoisomerase I n=3 Tax=Amphimedon queenslandica TaxID=400682 RepID=A0AAN0IMN3_AMPQE|nr:PREDICTED: DNA topoisomerase I, mitochondrial-like [Amphimedon queenslandica]|eukprot:XP_011404857.2 PREDICTED: DNA topoisomerase I, mitochondrial-like [Amphimedon queenslandica]
MKDEDNDWEGSGGSPDDDDDDFKPVAKKPKKSVSDEKKASTPKKTPSTKTPTSTKKPSSSRKNSVSKPDTPTTKIKKDPTLKKTTPSSAKKATPAKKTSDSKKGSGTPGKDVGGTPVKGKKKEEEREVWRWWDEEPHPEGVKWLTLEHKGPYFAPPYERLPSDVKFYYNGKPMKLSEAAEEAATFFAKMLDHDYTSKDVFCNNFFADWRKEMTSEEAATIKDFTRCNFKEIHEYFLRKSEEKKQMTKEEKKKIKEANDAITEEYGWAIMDGHKEKIGNFKTEPPGLFRGRGDHPKQGKIKRRVQPEDVTINIGKKAPVPPAPEGHKWKSVQHDNKVTWLASWTENIQSQIKYVMLNPTSRLKGEKDLAKYETARRLKGRIEEIRRNYESDLKSRETAVRQRAVALYFIDKLALRAGNEKDADEAADTVGCCSLRVEHIKLHEELNGKSDMVVFDFLGKDSIRYYNEVQVTHQVFKNLHIFMKGKETGDDLFDRLSTALLNKHLSELMEGLTAKVFRTYNASITLQEQLEELTKEDDTVNEKILSYNRANRAVAVLCNHQRTAPKTFDTQMSNLQAKITAKEEAILDAKKEIKKMKKELKGTSDSKLQKKLESKVKQLPKLEEQLKKLEIQATDKEENKEIALGTSKLNYLDPRISVSWCKKWGVPIEKVYNRTQREKFAWAIEMADETFVF